MGPERNLRCHSPWAQSRCDGGDDRAGSRGRTGLHARTSGPVVSILIAVLIVMELSSTAMGHDLRFPRLVAETLSGAPLVLPDSLDDEWAVVVLAFRRHAQHAVDSWLAPVGRRYSEAPDVSWYEIPMLAGGWRMISGFIDGGMRAGISPAQHDRVATYYGDTSRFRDALAIDDLDTAHVYLIDDAGAVHWSASGWAHQRRYDELVRTLERLRSDSMDA